MRTQITQIENSKLQEPNSKFQEPRTKRQGEWENNDRISGDQEMKIQIIRRMGETETRRMGEQ
ncbi:MAG: hypothetical protein V3T09_05195 [bacterium]